MLAPTKDDAYNSPHIVLAEYLDYLPNKEGTAYFAPPIARYKIIRILKGEQVPQTLKLRYDFSDGTACIAPKKWEFNDKFMPEPKSKWLLFLQGKNKSQIFSSYRGPFGRMKASKQNVTEAEASIRKNK